MNQAQVVRRLVEEARNGDRAAFQALYEHYVTRIYNFLFRLLGSKEEAEDATQQTFLIVLRQLGSLRDPDVIESWIYRIARNEVYQKFRKKKVDSLGGGDDEESEVATVEEGRLHANPERTLLNRELGEVLQSVLDGLPLKLREVFVLAVIQEIRYQEISEIVGRSLLSVKTDIYRARVLAKEKLGRYLEAGRRPQHTSKVQ